jgi:choline dehydrogenase
VVWVETDYVVVGIGSAGSVLANRLSADLNVEIAVLEAGPRDKDKFIHIPAAWAKLFRSPLDWDYLTEPQKELAGREIYWPRGKILGGSSSINAMIWARGFAAESRTAEAASRCGRETRRTSRSSTRNTSPTTPGRTTPP